MIEEVKPGLFVKQTKSGKWIKVNPIRIDGKINWKNLIIGESWIMLLIIFLLICSAFAYKHDTKLCREIMSHPCNYSVSHCPDQYYQLYMNDLSFFNITRDNLTNNDRRSREENTT